MFDKTDKKSKLDEETKKNFKEIENRDKKGFMKYFSYEPTTLVNKLLNQNTQDLRKSLNEIKQQKITLNKGKRNNTNNKNENDRLNMILSVNDRIYQFFEYIFLPAEQSDELKLPKWVKVSQKRFNEILSTVTWTKNDGLETSVDARKITPHNTERLIKGTVSGKIDGSEFKKRTTILLMT